MNRLLLCILVFGVSNNAFADSFRCGRSIVGASNWVYDRKGKKDMVVSIRSGTVIKIQVD